MQLQSCMQLSCLVSVIQSGLNFSILLGVNESASADSFVGLINVSSYILCSFDFSIDSQFSHLHCYALNEILKGYRY